MSTTNNNLEIYNSCRAVPEDAKKPIAAGRLKGKTDINPMWRIKKLTETFGPCGIGWWYEIKDKRLDGGADGEIAAFVDISLYYKHGDTVSQPIPGTGGSMFVAKERNGPYTSDECFKMALTDAISVAAKALGMGADVYWSADRSKYDTDYTNDKPDSKPKDKPVQTSTLRKEPDDLYFRCENCGEVLKPYAGADGKQVGIRKHAEGSKAKFGKVYCINCISKMNGGNENA